MTEEVNFAEVKQLMGLLKSLRAEVDSGNWLRRELCTNLHEEVSRQLLPLFEDLAKMGMVVLFTKAEGGRPATVQNLVVTGLNGGIQLSKK